MILNTLICFAYALVGLTVALGSYIIKNEEKYDQILVDTARINVIVNIIVVIAWYFVSVGV